MDMDSLSEQDEMRIDDYLSGELSETARQAFEAELRARPVLAAAFEDQRQMYLTLWLEGNQAEREALQAALDMPEEAVVRPLHRQRWFQVAVAASILLLLLFTMTRGWAERNYADRQLALAYVDEAASMAGLTKSSAPNDSLAPLRQALSQQDYQMVQQLIGLAPNPSEQPIPAFWWGYAHLQLGLAGDETALDEAAAMFATKRWQQAATSWRQQAAWYNVLTSFAQADPHLPLLQEIARDNAHPYQPKAQALSKDQQAFWRNLAR